MKNLHRFLLSVGTTMLLGSFVWAQQDKIITHFIYDKMSLNPGETGIDEGICGAMIYRNQWDKVAGAPVSMVFNAEANINRYFPGGVGISFYHDQIGFARQNNLLLNYAYPIFTDYGIVQVGLGVGMFNYGLDPNFVPPTDAFDPLLLGGAFSTIGLDLNFGAYFKANEGYYIGISSTHLNAPRLTKEVQAGPFTLEQAYSAARHYYIMGGYTTEPYGPGRINGNLLFRTDMIKSSLDLNARYIMPISTYDVYGGLTFRTNDAIAVMLGGTKNNFTVGYSYDLTINKLASISRGSHEILLRYCYYLPPIPKTPSKHPRWL